MADTELSDCIAIIRSLVLIRKQITTLRDIKMGYKSMEGEPIPYQRLGYDTLEAMLQASNQFNLIQQYGGEVRTASTQTRTTRTRILK